MLYVNMKKMVVKRLLKREYSIDKINLRRVQKDCLISYAGIHDDLLCVIWFRQLLGYFNSFPITAFQFTTNEPQSYVLDGRNHPLHSNS